MTYSSAVLFSNVVQDYGFARVAGIGGAARTWQSGGVQSLVLPNTGLELSFPRFVLARPSGAAEPRLLQPDLPLADDPLHPHAAVDALLIPHNGVAGEYQSQRTEISGSAISER